VVARTISASVFHVAMQKNEGASYLQLILAVRRRHDGKLSRGSLNLSCHERWRKKNKTFNEAF